MTLFFKNRLVTLITEEIGAADAEIRILAQDFGDWISGMASGDEYRAVLIDPRNVREVVKVKSDGSAAPDTLAVERGQEGSGAKEWAKGTLIFQDITGEMLDGFIQRGIFRQGAFDPNATLTALYFGEEFYQTDQRFWWKAVAAGSSVWKLIVGSACGIDFTRWSANEGSFDVPGCKILSDFVGIERIDLSPFGVWHIGYRPAQLRVTISAAIDRIRMYSNVDPFFDIMDQFLVPAGTSTFALDWSQNNDFDHLFFEETFGDPQFEVTEIQFID